MRQLLLGLTAFLTLTVAHGQTNISGGIYSDTSWSKANNPFIITGTVLLHDVTLTVQPGVIVKFANNARLQCSTQNDKIIALGTITDSITFTSNSLSPSPGIYFGIDLAGNRRKSFLNYCNFFYATYAINDGGYWDSLMVKHSLFANNNTAIYRGSWGPEGNLIDSCIFKHNTNCGLEDLYNSKITNCIVDSNAIGLQGGSQVSVENTNFSSNQIAVKTIMDCSFTNCYFGNNQSGLMINNTANGNFVSTSTFENNQYGILDTTLGNNSILKCYIKNNFVGVFLKNGGSSTIDSCFIINNQSGVLNNGNNKIIKNSTIDSNSIAGINFDTPSNNNSVINCKIRKNGTGIIDVGGNSPNLFTKNSIENNLIGIQLENSTEHIYCNKICNNKTYSLKYMLPGNTNVSDNYWCTSDSSSTSILIHDGKDSIGLGVVQFMPLDTMQCYLCNYNIISLSYSYPTCSTCNNGTATANAKGVSPFTYSWNTSPIQTTQTATGLSHNRYYTVCVTDFAGCTDCDSVYFSSTVFVKEYSDKINFLIYPNPFSTQAVLRADTSFHNATLSIDNCFGQTVKQIKNISGQTVTFNRDNLPSGLYFLRLTEDNKILSVDKIVITDNH